MTEQDAFVQKLSALLEDLPTGYDLADSQALYRQVIFTVGFKILERFQLDAGRGWRTGGEAATGGQGGGPHPHFIGNFLDFPAFVLGLRSGESNSN